MSSESESDLEMQSSLPKKRPEKLPKSPSEEHLKKEPKKLSTKEMINSALKESNSRKGISLQAIKKHMVEKYYVNPEKINFYIKKYIKSGVESGTIVQIKGVGASGSFRLAPVKKTTKKKVEKKEKPEKTKKIEITKKKSEDKAKNKMVKKGKTKEPELKSKKEKLTKEPKEPKVTKEREQKKTKEIKERKEPTVKMAKIAKMAKATPAKKGAKMMKRKSVGSIIKPPKMKPKKRD